MEVKSIVVEGNEDILFWFENSFIQKNLFGKRQKYNILNSGCLDFQFFIFFIRNKELDFGYVFVVKIKNLIFKEFQFRRVE